MNIEKVRNKINSYKGQTMQFRFNGSRNQIEEFTGEIEGTYNYIFVIRTNNEPKQLKSFSYSDVLTESLEIFVK